MELKCSLDKLWVFPEARYFSADVVHAKHSNIDKEELQEAFAKHKQWYIPAEEALALGLVDAIAPTKESEYNKKKKTFSMKLDGLSYESTFA